MTRAAAWPQSPFTRRDLSALGLGESQLRRALRVGELCTVLRGVFLGAHVDLTIEVRARAVAAIVGPHHVVTDRTAAWLHGMDCYVWAEHDLVPPIEACALRGFEPTTRGTVDGRTRDLRSEDITVVHGVRVTTPLRTALDLGCGLRRREAYAVLNEMARQHDLSRDDYLRALPRYRRRRGVIQLRELVLVVDPRVESPRESWVLLAVLDAGLPAPQPQFWVEIDGEPTFRLDFAYPRLRVCVEYDGVDWHDRTPEQRERDGARREWLRDNGWTVVVVKRGDFSEDNRERWLAEIRGALVPAYSNRRW